MERLESPWLSTPVAASREDDSLGARTLGVIHSVTNEVHLRGFTRSCCQPRPRNEMKTPEDLEIDCFQRPGHANAGDSHGLTVISPGRAALKVSGHSRTTISDEILAWVQGQDRSDSCGRV